RSPRRPAGVVPPAPAPPTGAAGPHRPPPSLHVGVGRVLVERPRGGPRLGAGDRPSWAVLRRRAARGGSGDRRFVAGCGPVRGMAPAPAGVPRGGRGGRRRRGAPRPPHSGAPADGVGAHLLVGTRSGSLIRR